jgi:hypothetical protein
MIIGVKKQHDTRYFRFRPWKPGDEIRLLPPMVDYPNAFSTKATMPGDFTDWLEKYVKKEGKSA